MIGYDAKKGYFNSKNGFIVNFEPDQECGLDMLPWDTLGEEDASESEEEDKHGENNDTPKKLSKQQKKEIRQNKKIIAAKKRKMKRELELKASSELNSSHQAPVVNRYETVNKIKSAYNNILQKVDGANGKPHGTSASSDQKILQYHSVALYKSDLNHILPEEWLCDNNIAFMYEVLCNQFLSKIDFPHEIALLNPSLVQLFLHIPYDPVDKSVLESILPVKELSKLKFIFLPMNYIDDFELINMEEANNGDHWFLAVLNLLDNKLYVYDSMTSDEDDDTLLVELTKRLQDCKSIVKHGKIDIIKMKCQQQDNFDDCGIFLVVFTCVLINRLIRLSETVDEENETIVSLDISKLQVEPLLGRLHLLNVISQMYKTKE